MTKHLFLLPGDGIGTEIMAEVARLIAHLNKEGLTDFTTDTGVPCRFAKSGEQRELSPGARLALYRVAQEALTNVRKHAVNPEQAEVRLDYQQGTVTLTVEDTVRQRVRTGAQHTRQHEMPRSGYGLTGMRERAELLGGVLEAGPTDTGFRVRLGVPA